MNDLTLEDLSIGMYVHSNQLSKIKGVYIFLDIGNDCSKLSGKIVFFTKELNEFTDKLSSRENIGVFYQPEYKTLGGFKIYK